MNLCLSSEFGLENGVMVCICYGIVNERKFY